MTYQLSGATDASLPAHEFSLVGSADVHTGLHHRVAGACADGARLILVDISGVTGVTPSGLADLLHAWRAARSHGGDLRAYGHSPALADAMAALDLGRVFTIHPDRHEALSLSGIPGRAGGNLRRWGFRTAKTGKHSRSAASS